jgi:NADH-quinone oxidoreductase subunit A
VTNAFATEWTAVLLAAVVGLMAMMAMFIGNWILSPKRASQLKGIPYECGIIPGPYQWSQMQIRYYVFAIDFLIFDVEAVFLFPWALLLDGMDVVMFYSMILFIGLLFFGILYGWKKGVLEWR